MTVFITDPASPNSAAPTTLFVGFSSNRYCLDVASSDIRSGNDFVLTLTEGSCPFEPPGFNFAPFKLGLLAPGKYNVSVTEIDADTGIVMDSGSYSFQVISTVSTVPALTAACGTLLVALTAAIAVRRLGLRRRAG